MVVMSPCHSAFGLSHLSLGMQLFARYKEATSLPRLISDDDVWKLDSLPWVVRAPLGPCFAFSLPCRGYPNISDYPHSSFSGIRTGKKGVEPSLEEQVTGGPGWGFQLQGGAGGGQSLGVEPSVAPRPQAQGLPRPYRMVSLRSSSRPGSHVPMLVPCPLLKTCNDALRPRPSAHTPHLASLASAVQFGTLRVYPSLLP